MIFKPDETLVHYAVKPLSLDLLAENTIVSKSKYTTGNIFNLSAPLNQSAPPDLCAPFNPPSAPANPPSAPANPIRVHRRFFQV